MRKETRCPLLKSLCEGAELSCEGKVDGICPKSKNKEVITTACWRIKI